MPLRQRDGNWHYRFWLDGREYTGSTDLVATERNRNAAARVEAKARELVSSGRAHELKLQVKPFSDAAREFLTWADGEYTKHPEYGEAAAHKLREPFAVLQEARPYRRSLRGHVNDFKAWRRKEHDVREITIRHDLHALSKAFGYFIDHNWARENPVRGVEIPERQRRGPHSRALGSRGSAVLRSCEAFSCASRSRPADDESGLPAGRNSRVADRRHRP